MKEIVKIGIMGSRGIPNRYGGFEQLAEYLSRGLAEKGHNVSVYNSSTHPYKDEYFGLVRIIHCFEPGFGGSASQFIYDLNCLRDARKREFDILLHLGYTSDSVWHFIWSRTSIHLVNMDGLEWKRAKYNALTKRFLSLAEKWAVKKADCLVADSEGIREYLKTRYEKPSAFIPYGAEKVNAADAGILSKWSLQKQGYDLAICRFEPENNPETTIMGWLQSGSQKKLLLVGDTTNRYGKQLREKYENANLVFTGPLYDKTILDSLRSHCNIYFHGHSVGGTNPSLLEAMACGCVIAAHKNIFNVSVLGRNAFYFEDPADVSRIHNEMNAFNQKENWKMENYQKLATVYNWKRITEQYEDLMLCLKKTSCPDSMRLTQAAPCAGI